MTDTNWTIAYRKPKANHFKRVADLAVSWVDAGAWARAARELHPDLEFWYVPTAVAETNGYSHAEDHGNILTNTGKRVRIADTGSLAELGMEIATENTEHAVTVELPFADKVGTATYRLTLAKLQANQARAAIAYEVANMGGNETKRQTTMAAYDRASRALITYQQGTK